MKAKILLILALVFGGSLSTTLPAWAEEKNDNQVRVQISPVSDRPALNAGEELEYSFTVQNLGTAASKFKIYAAPYSVVNEDYDLSFSKENKRTQLSRWVSFFDGKSWVKEYSLSIDANKKEVIRYRITVPKDIPSGGQYAAIFAESAPESKLTTSGVTTVSRVGLVLYGATRGNTRQEAKITALDFKTFLAGEKLIVSSKVKNTGNTDFVARHELTVKSLFGKVLYPGSSVNNVLPDTEHRTKMEWEHTPAIGIFQVSYKVTALDQVSEVTRVVVSMPIFVMIIALIVLTLLIAWIIILIRKRKQEKSRRLV